MARILGVGVATLDIVNLLERYPAEDDEVRASAQRISRGGNAGNTLAVLSMLGHEAVFVGMLAEDADGLRVRDQFEHEGIDFAGCPRREGGRTPTSYICSSQQTGSRTIVHYRDLPELSYSDFARVDLKGVGWVHFEGRSVDETRRMIARVRNLRPRVRVSVEIEKARPGIDSLFDGPDLVLFSRNFATSQGFDNPRRFLQTIRMGCPRANLVCAWGDQGGYAYGINGREHHEPAWVPEQVVDTLAAGDVFNAGIIHALHQGRSLDESLRFAVRLAGLKCGVHGLAALADKLDDEILEPIIQSSRSA
ncbi:MAG: PfkB family carbohydrate kinase [Gammaproteobacteria bacterium]